MDTIYLISLIVGGFFVLLSLFGADSDADADVDVDFDADVDMDFDVDTEVDVDGGDFDAHTEIGSGPGLVDLFSIRALFLFAAFFGLTGTLLALIGTGELATAIASIMTGLVVGLGGNYLIKRIGYAHVSSDVSAGELRGVTGKVLIPFTGSERGKISLVVKGSLLRLTARSLDENTLEEFAPGDEVVVVRTDNGVAEVVKPN